MATIKEPLKPAETLAAFYLLAPLFMFFAGFVRVEIAVPASTLLCFLTYDLVRHTCWHRPAQLGMTAYFLLLAAVWVLLSSGIGPLQQNGDWHKHYGILNFLAEHPWPAAQHFAAFGDAVIRYYLGWYLVPSIILKITGAPLQAFALSIWSILGVFLFFNLLPELIGRRGALFAAPIVFVLFGGADFVGTLITRYQYPVPYHFEWWAQWAQFSGNTTALFWVPQHALPAWLGAALVMRWREQGEFLRYGAALGAATLLWSPFSTIGLLPFIVVLIVRHGWRKLVRDWRALTSVVLLAVPVALYLSAGADEILRGFIAAMPCTRSTCFSWSSYLLFLALEVSAPLAIVWLRGQPEHGFVAAAAIALCLIPLYKVGIANDFAMRASLPSLAVLAILCAKTFVRGPRPWSVAVAIVLLAALPTAAGEIARGFMQGNEVSSDQIMTDEYGRSVLTQYFAPHPIWILR